MLKAIIDHFDAMVLFDSQNGETIYSNHEFKEIFKDTITNIEDMESFFKEYYKSDQNPIFNTIEIDSCSYLVKRKYVKNSILYHLESNNYYINIIQNIKKQAIIDELTQCYNKKEFENIFKRMLATTHRYSNTNFAVIMLDLDHFKNINDSYGHLTGDYILKEVADIVHHEVRDSDIFGRIGGEEFIILLPQTKLNGALKTAQKIRKSIDEYRFSFKGESVHVTLSLGITSTTSNDTYFSVLDRVDKALYKAKDDGRNRVEYF